MEECINHYNKHYSSTGLELCINSYAMTEITVNAHTVCNSDCLVFYHIQISEQQCIASGRKPVNSLFLVL